MDLVQFNCLAGADNVVILAFRPLAENSRVALGHRMVQLFAAVKKFYLVGEDTDGALADRDIAPVDSLATAKIQFDFIGFNQRTLVTIRLQCQGAKWAYGQTGQ